ncbi:hypothetical protein HDU87_004227, partial [Geranomyces variabilis]
MDGVFAAIKAVWGSPLIDLFADPGKPRAERYCGPKLPSQPGWLNLDGFSVSWATHRLLYAHVATQDARRVLDKVRRDETPALILVSRVADADRAELLQWSSDHPLLLPPNEEGEELIAYLLTGNPVRADYFSRRGNPSYGFLMEHPRVLASQSSAAEHFAFKVDTAAPKKYQPHKVFSTKAQAVEASWSDVADDLIANDDAAYHEDVVNPDHAPRTHPLWTLATINGFWAPVILDAGASRSLISGYESVLFQKDELTDMPDINFSG